MLIRKLLTLLTLAACCSVTHAAVDEWKYSLSPYIWFAGLKGDVATLPPLPPASIDVSPSEAIDDSEVAFMLLFDAKKNGHGMHFGISYTDTRQDEEAIPAPIDLMMRAISKTTLVTAAYQYEVYNDRATVIDVLAGVRYWDLDSELKFRGGQGILAGETISHDESWIDPVVGAKGVTYFGSNSQFYVSGSAGLGGFGVGSDLFYDMNLNLGYRWTDTIGTAIGYRVFQVDYEDGDFLYDAKQHGFLLSLTWSF